MGRDLELTLVGSARPRRNFAAIITVAFATMVIAALLLAGVGILWASHESDTVSVERQARSAHHAMESSVDELALQQETVAVWDDSASHLVTARPDMTWVHDNIGSWLNRMFGHDEVFILDGNDRPIYASSYGAQVPLRRYAMLARDLQPVVSSVRGRELGPNGRHDRNPGRRLSRDNSVRTTSRATHDSHMMRIGGRPAAASAMLIQPSTPAYVRPDGEWPVLISLRYLDAGFLAELSSRQLISSPRFSRRSDPRKAEHSVPLKTEGGRPIGFLIWEPELPGTRILWKLVPLSFLILFVLFSFMAFLGRRLRRAACELATAEATAAHLAFHDSLTGLPNRALFQKRLQELTTGGEAAPCGFALLILDVDEFKLTNDTLGHDAGDAILLAFANRLEDAVRPGDMVARLGGDEFALLLVAPDGADELKEFAARLLNVLGEPCDHLGKKIQCRASIGAAIFSGDDSTECVLKHADLALYEAKASGRGVFRLYDPTMWAGVLVRREMLTLASEVLEGDYIRPFYQPKVHLQTGEVVGFEALLRCCVPGESVRGPECIAAAFDDSALASQLSDRMIEGVINDISAWQQAGLPFQHVAINASAAELRTGDFADRLLGRLDQAQIASRCIQIEVTESVLLGRGIEHVERTFNQLAERGIILALDDFGTGFASLTHLKQFPVQIIKIDRSFVRDLQIDEEDGAIVDALIGLGRALGIEVIAEGIETEEQRTFLRALGCTIGQGYHFGAALPADRVSEILRSQACVAA